MISDPMSRADLMKVFGCDKKELSQKIKEARQRGCLMQRMRTAPDGKRTAVYHLLAEQTHLF